MPLPVDVASLRYGTWNRRSSDAWTDFATRSLVVAFLDAFLAEHGWANAWDCTERFADNGISVKVRRTPPVQPAERDDFQQRPGLRLLIMGVTRKRDTRRFEVAISFGRGTTTVNDSIAMLLDRTRESFRANEKAAR